MLTGADIHLPYLRTPLLGSQAIFPGITVGAYTDIEKPAIRTGRQILRPVMVDPTGG